MTPGPSEKSRFRSSLGASRLLLLLIAVFPSALGAQTEAPPVPSVTYTKDFPHSQPDYFSIHVREDGQAVYRTAPDDDRPVEFRLPPEATQEIFSLARKLHGFGDGLESKRRVASMGKKTLAYQDGAERYETSFNHTEWPDAVALVSLFERISQTRQHQLRIEYLLRFDKLGIVKELLLLESNLDQQRLLDPEQLLPALERIRSDNRLVQVAQGRAAHLIEKIRSAKP